MKQMILLPAILILLTGCNYKPFELKYNFNYAYCNYKFLPEEIKIKSWTDYEGEQIQIIDENDNVLIISSYHCVLSKEQIVKE